MSEATVVADAQVDLYGKISRTAENLRKLPAAKTTLGVLEARLQNLESNWRKFNTQDDRLFPHRAALTKHAYYEQDIMFLTEEAYLSNKAVLLDQIRDAQAKDAAAPPAAAPQAAASSAMNSTVTGPRTTLPRIQLPHFSGRYEDWPAFRDLFKSIIDRDVATTKVEKLHYLRSCLKGEAELLIRDISLTGTNYERAWNSLTGFYENKRLLVRSYLSTFLALNKMKVESATELRRTFHGIKSTFSSLQSIDRPISSCEDLFVHLAVDLLDPRSRREWESIISSSADPPSYDALEGFLERRLHMLEAILPTKSDIASGKTGASAVNKTTRNHLAKRQDSKTDTPRGGRCSLCDKDHFLMLCADYRRKTAAERRQHVETKSLCLNCLGRHPTNECMSKKTCSACEKRHHTSLHDACREKEISTSALVAKSQTKSLNQVLLATARVRVQDDNGIYYDTRALIDQGSESSMITERLAQRLRLKRSPISVSIYGFGGQKTGVARGLVSLSLSPRFGGETLIVSALVFSRLTAYNDGARVERKSWSHVQGLELADPNFSAADPIDILLGADVYGVILEAGLRKGEGNEPVAQNTKLGWILSGNIGETSVRQNVVTHQCQVEDELNSLVRRFWDQEEPPTTPAALTMEELQCEAHFSRTHSRDPDGRYTVRLPLVTPLPELSDTRRASLNLLRKMETRFKQDRSFHDLYATFMQQYIDLGHMTKVSPVTAGEKVCFLPHHGVLRPDSTSTKLRVVFNGSSRLNSGESLNQFLLVGPNLLPALADILTRWRLHRYVLAADIEKMYRQINTHPQDRDLQRILWRERPTDEISEYQLNTVTYGLACAPFLAIRTLRQLADDEEDKLALGARALRQDVYMDDILTGAATIEETTDLQNQLIKICRAGGFPLKKWSANCAALLSDLPASDLLQQQARWWLPGESHSTLGLRWHPQDDCFAYSTRLIRAEAITRRSVLALTARLFDPLGWLAPVIIRAKIEIQSTWLLGLDWDAPLPMDDVRKWRSFEADIPLLESIRIPRWLTTGPDDLRLEIHGFADASERAYAAVAYLKTKGPEGTSEVRIIAARTKVAPLKQVSLPRLELCAATLLVRLIAHYRRTLGIIDAPLHLWTDSTVTLGWIRGHPSAWKTYVANRVSEIQTSLPEGQWHHIPGRHNPADCASRGLTPGELVNHPLWWYGPSWLLTDDFPPGDETRSQNADLPERRLHIVTTNDQDAEPDLLTRYSDLRRLLRITAWCRRWRRPAAATPHPDTHQGLSADEITAARMLWLRVVQTAKYKNEITALKKGKPLSGGSSLIKLSPYLDNDDILRLGGRLEHAHLTRDAKHPAILPGSSHFTRLTIDACHRRTLHGGVQLTLCTLRQEYWIPRGRALVKSCIHRCLACLRWRAASPQPRMGDLPTPRVNPSRPFTNTGVDYAGPVWLRTSKGRGHKSTKAFFVIFICLASRAVHLDVASDYSADAFLAALRRFVSRRGLCKALYSDCGTNFVGADAQLRKLFSSSSREGRRIAAHAADEQIKWHFNPPASPNFGGIWEAAVKATKHHLRRVIGEATLTYEEMATLLTQVEACLNSRPLQAISDDPNDLTALTPGHFLVGTALNAIPEPTLEAEKANRLSRWQFLQKMRDQFWARWSKEYLHSLANRPKWFKDCEDVRVDRLCLLRSEITPPNKWPLARIEKLYPGSDGRVRVADVRTATSRFTRPLTKLVLLPDSQTAIEKGEGAN